MSNDKEILYSAKGRTGTFYEEPEDVNPLDEYRIALYMKVGLFFGWSWQDFEATPLPVTERLSEEIDFRLENADSDICLNWNGLAFFLAIAKAFGKGSE